MANRQLIRRCPVCGCSMGSVLYSPNFELSTGNPLPRTYEVVACESCGFCFADTPATQEVYDTYYAQMSKYADGKSSTGSGSSPCDAERLCALAEQISDFAPDRSARILDFGCANGGLLSALRSKGYVKLCGIDPSSACVEQARVFASDGAWTGTLSHLPECIGRFDGVVLSHVMEHVCDLKSAMRKVRDLLNPGGWVYVEVPDAMRYTEHLVAPYQDINTEHINHFSRRSMENLLSQNGFSPAEGGQKKIFSAAGMPYPAAYVFARLSPDSKPIIGDLLLRPALEAYLSASNHLLKCIDKAIQETIAVHPSLIVWGTGQLTLRLLAETCLRDAQIDAFVDSNPVNQGRKLRGVRILSPKDLVPGQTPILISSVINAQAIHDTIHSLDLGNPTVEFVDVLAHLGNESC